MRKSWLQVPTEAKIPSCSLGEERTHVATNRPSVQTPLLKHVPIRIPPLFRVESSNTWCGPHASLRMKIRVPESGTCLTCPVLSPRVIPSTPEDYCYLVRHAMKQPWQLNWIKLCLLPLHERRVSDSESSTVALEMSLLCCWRAGGEGGCEVGVLWRRMACASSPSLYHTHQLHPLSVVDIYFQPGYRSMLEM